MLHLLGFDHEISEEAEAEMEKVEELLLKSSGWKGKGLIQNAYDAETTMNLQTENLDGNYNVLLFVDRRLCILCLFWSYKCYKYFGTFSLQAESDTIPKPGSSPLGIVDR